MIAARKSLSANPPEERKQVSSPTLNPTQFGQPLLPNWREQIGLDPHRPGINRARLIEPGIPVWAIIGHLKSLGTEFTSDLIAEAAFDYKTTITDVTAAVPFYLDHRESIDARLIINAEAVA